MKTLVLLTSVFILQSCIDKMQEKPVSRSQRIIIKEEMRAEGYSCAIVQVDSVEYLVNYQGGIIPLIKQP